MKTNVLFASVASLLMAAPVLAQTPPKVEVMHFWTSGGEAAALATIRDKVVAQGVQWNDAPVAGGGGDQAKTVLQARIASGNPPAAMLMLGQNILQWAQEGLLGNVDAVASRENWDKALPDAVKAFSKVGGHYVSAPTNVHRTDMMWASRAAFEKIGAQPPKSWEELNALLPRFREAGIIPLAHGGQPWQEAYMFEAVALGIGGADFYRKALIELDAKTLNSPVMIEVFSQLARLRDATDANAAGREWNLASAMVIRGEAALQIMGDWAKGEFTNAGKQPGSDYFCLPVPKKHGDGFVYLVNSLSFFAQKDSSSAKAQEVLASAIMDPATQVAFNRAKGAIPARSDADFSTLDSCARQTAADFSASDRNGTAVPTFAGSHAAAPDVTAAATDAITDFFNSRKTAEKGAEAFAKAVLAVR